MARLDEAKQKKLSPERMNYAISKLSNIVLIKQIIEGTEIQFYWRDGVVKFFPYSGWATGKSINDCRGISNLLKQLK